MFFLPYDEWMELTKSRLASRSDTLKALDKAIQEAEEASEEDDTVMKWFADGGSDSMPPAVKSALDIEKAARGVAVAEVRKAFNAWTADQARRGQDWRQSVRNERGACQRLADQIAYWTRTYPDTGERAALQYLVEQRNASIPLLFKDCVVIAHSDLGTQYTTLNAKKNAAKIAYDSWKLAGAPRPHLHHGGGGGGAEAAIRAAINSHVDGMVREAFGSVTIAWDHAEASIASVLQEAIEAIKDEIAFLIPGAGLAVASASATYAGIKLVMQSIAADELVTLTQRLEESDSRAALHRVRDWQLRTIAKLTSKSIRAGVNVGMHIASIASLGVGLPAQLATSLATAIVALAEVIGDLGMQYKEKRALTAYLNAGTLGREIFAQAPLAAAYYLLNTPTSHIALQLTRIGAPGWQADVEHLVKSGGISTVLSESQNLIQGARYRIIKKDGSRFRERVSPSLITKLKKKVKGVAA